MPLNCAVSTRSPTYTFIKLGTASELVLPQPFYYVTWAWVGCQVEIFVFSSGNWWDLNLGSFDWQSSALTTWPHSCMVVWLYCLQTHSRVHFYCLCAGWEGKGSLQEMSLLSWRLHDHKRSEVVHYNTCGNNTSVCSTHNTIILHYTTATAYQLNVNL